MQGTRLSRRPAALADLLGGQLDFMFDPGIGLGHVKAGKLKLLAAGTPAEMIARLNREVSRLMQAPPLTDRLNAIGAQGQVLAPDAFAARLRSEHERMGALVKVTGLRVE